MMIKLECFFLTILVICIFSFVLYYTVNKLECLVDDMEILREQVLQLKEESTQNVSEYESDNDDALMSYS